MDLKLNKRGVGYGIRLELPFNYDIRANWKWAHGLIPNPFEN
jgi:hypothetical protein